MFSMVTFARLLAAFYSGVLTTAFFHMTDNVTVLKRSVNHVVTYSSDDES